EAVRELACIDQTADLLDREPFDPVGLDEVRLALEGRTVGEEDVEALVAEAAERVVREERPGRAGAPPGFLERRARRRLPGRLALVDSAAGDLPAPRVDDEAVAVKEQHTALRVVDDGRGRLLRDAHDVVPESPAVRQLDVRERDREPLALVERALAVH